MHIGVLLTVSLGQESVLDALMSFGRCSRGRVVAAYVDCCSLQRIHLLSGLRAVATYLHQMFASLMDSLCFSEL